MREITLNEFIEGVEKGLISDTIFIGNNVNRVYGKSVKGMADKPNPYEIVWAKVP